MAWIVAVLVAGGVYLTWRWSKRDVRHIARPRNLLVGFILLLVGLLTEVSTVHAYTSPLKVDTSILSVDGLGIVLWLGALLYGYVKR